MPNNCSTDRDSLSAKDVDPNDEKLEKNGMIRIIALTQNSSYQRLLRTFVSDHQRVVILAHQPIQHEQ
jgi:hypothetical protein